MICIICKNAQSSGSRATCDACALNLIDANFQWLDPLRRASARQAKLHKFRDLCNTHLITEFSTRTGNCLACSRRTPRSAARRAGDRTYAAACPTHGIADHFTASGLCCGCVEARRLSQLPALSPRKQARRAGASTYLGTCEVHGETNHSVLHAKCLACFRTNGVRRAPTQGPEYERARARRYGWPTYPATCPAHGLTAFRKWSGRCVACNPQD